LLGDTGLARRDALGSLASDSADAVPDAVVPGWLLGFPVRPTRIRWPHLRHFILKARPATRSSATWYFVLQLGQRNFIQPSELSTRST
jgi:hypothetical protein